MRYTAMIFVILSFFFLVPAFSQQTDSSEDVYVTIGETYEVRLAKDRNDKFVKWIQIEDNFKTNHFVGSVTISYTHENKKIFIKCVGCDSENDFIIWDGNYRVTPDDNREYTGRQSLYEFTTKEGLHFKITRHSRSRYTMLARGRIKQFKSWKDE